MRTPGFMRTPFALSGDKTAIPNDVQPGGQVSMLQGYGPDYAKDLVSDPTAKAIDRAQMNQLLWIMSTLIGRWQSETFPEWIDPASNNGVAFPYSIGTIVRVASGSSWVLRQSRVDNNTEVPDPAAPSANWADAIGGLSNAVLKDQATLQSMAGPLAVGLGSTVLGTTMAATVNDKRIVTAEWATVGKGSEKSPAGNTSGTSRNSLSYPTWMTGPGNQNVRRLWGVAPLSSLGYNGRYMWQSNPIPIFAAPISPTQTANLCMLSTINVIPNPVSDPVSVACNMPDYQNLVIRASSLTDYGPNMFASWSVDYIA